MKADKTPVTIGIAISFAVVLFLLSGCSTTVYNDQSACTTDCNIGGSGYYSGIGGADISNDQSECTHDCNIGTTGAVRIYSVPPQVHWTPNVTYYPYHLRYQRGPVVIYHY